MAYLGNSPAANTVIVVEARKSFALALWLKDPHGKPVNLAECELTIVAKPEPIDDNSDVTNFLAASAYANVPLPTDGYAIFNLQASSLNQDPGEYPFSIVLKDRDGYTTVLVKGILDIRQNTEWNAVNSQYPSVNPPQSLFVETQQRNVVNVYIGGNLPPGMNWVRDDQVQAITEFDPDSVAYVPEGGTIGYVLTKIGTADFEMDWRPRENGPFGLDATGQPKNYVPAALGDGTWTWKAVGIDATGVTAGFAPVADGAGGWAWGSVSVPKPDWNVPAGSPAEILNKPMLGTAAAKNQTDFIAANTLVSAMPGVHFQATIPSSGIDGHLYFVYI
jgi:hypothetical protein